MNSVQRELVGYIKGVLSPHFTDWNIDVAENVFGHRWVVLFTEKTTDLMCSVAWFPFDRLRGEEDANFIVGGVITWRDKLEKQDISTIVLKGE